MPNLDKTQPYLSAYRDTGKGMHMFLSICFFPVRFMMIFSSCLCVWTVTHIRPLKPLLQLQRNALPMGLHAPPFWQGLGTHAVISISQRPPVCWGLQLHENPGRQIGIGRQCDMLHYKLSATSGLFYISGTQYTHFCGIKSAYPQAYKRMAPTWKKGESSQILFSWHLFSWQSWQRPQSFRIYSFKNDKDPTFPHEQALINSEEKLPLKG